MPVQPYRELLEDHQEKNFIISQAWNPSNCFKFIRPSPNSVFNCHNCKGIKYLTRLRLGLSHLREHKFKHSFQDNLNPFCFCDLNVEASMHFFLYCPLFTNQRHHLLSRVNDNDSSLTNTNDSILTHILLFGKASLDIYANTLLLNATMNYIILMNRFGESLLQFLYIYLCYIFISFTFFPYPNVFFCDYILILIHFLGLLLFIC